MKTLPFILITIFASALFADDTKVQSIADALDKAKAQHAKSISDSRAEFKATLDKRLVAISKQGNLELAKAVKSIREEFTDDQPIDKSIGRINDGLIQSGYSKYDIAIRRASKGLFTAYQRAITDLTRAGKIDEASAIKDEMEGLDLENKSKPPSKLPFARKLIDQDTHKGRAGQSHTRRNHQYRLMSDTPIDPRSTNLWYRAQFGHRGGEERGAVMVSFDDGQRWHKIDQWSRQVVKRSERTGGGYVRVDPRRVAASQRIKKVDRILVRFDYISGNDGLYITDVVWARR